MGPEPGFKERLRRFRSEKNYPWWSIVFGGPVGSVIAAAVADVAWITPNRVTVAAFLCRLAAAGCIVLGLTSEWHDIAAVVAMQAAEVLDCVDGKLARYRGMSSAFGAYLDKVTDVLGILAVMSAFGWRVHAQTGDEWVQMLCVGAVMLWSARMYAFWVVASLERNKGSEASASSGASGTGLGDRSFAQRLLFYLRQSYWIFYFGESDVNFWLGLALLTGWLTPIAYLFGIGFGGWSLVILVYWGLYSRRLDAKPAA
jgi:phosphatidylglycerophosphate synthase